MTLDREGNCTKISPELDEWRSRHSSRSPRNGWGRSQRISRSRSRSRSQSPAHHLRQEPAVNDRSRSRSGASGQICRDFSAGRCRKGQSCHFLHQDAQLYDNRRPLECGSPDDWEGRRRRTGSLRYSPDDIKDNVIRAEKSRHICNDYLKGRRRRGDTCRYVHHDTSADEFDKEPVEEIYRNRNHEHQSRDVRNTYPDHDHRSRDTYPEHDRRSRDTYPDHDHRSRDAYPDRDHRSREPYSDHDHGSRESYSDHDHRRRDAYPDRNHESDPPRRVNIPCKYFASGNCRYGTRCRFSHQVQEVCSPERRSRDNERDTDHKFEGHHGWDGPRRSDVTTVPTVPTVPGWEEVKETKEVNTLGVQDDKRDPDPKNETDQVWNGPSWIDATSASNVQQVHDWGDDKNEILEVAKDVTGARLGDDSWAHDVLIKPTWVPPATTIDKCQIQDKENPLQRKTENNVSITGLSTTPRGMDNFTGDMEISPRDIKQQTIFNSSTSQIPSILNVYFGAVQQGTAGEASSFEMHYHTDSFAVQNASHIENAPLLYPGERRDVVGDHIPQRQGIFQPDKISNINPIRNITPPRHSQPSLLSHPPRGEGMQDVSHNPSSSLENRDPRQSQPSILSHTLQEEGMQEVSHNASSILENRDPIQSQPTLLSHPQGEGMQEISHNPLSVLENRVDRPHVGSLASSAPVPGSTAHSTVSNEQLAQLSHLTASLTQLLENRQQLSQLSSAISPHGMPNLPDLAASAPPVSEALIQPNEAPDALKQCDPVSNSIESKMPNLGDQRVFSCEQKSAIYGIHENKLNQPEHLGTLKDDENGKEIVGLKATENGPSQDVGSDDGADDGKKLKDIKGIRPFKFALAEFVKELLKPSWEDGQVNKEAYKTIVKKVVDKVMETLGPQIPQTKEKIDLYLSYSKPKIDKLVQAYVGKHQKG